MPLSIALDDKGSLFQELLTEPFVGLDEHQGNLQPIELLDDGPADLAIATYNEMVAEFFDADFVDHELPGLPALLAEDREQNPLGNPDLKSKDAEIYEQGEKLRRVSDRAVVYRIGVNDPENGVLPTQPLKLPIYQRAQGGKDYKKRKR